MQTAETNTSRDWYVPSALNGLAIVALSDGVRNFGLFRVKQTGERSLWLVPGAFSFPVGMHLDVEDFKYRKPSSASFQQRTTVVENDRNGIRLVW